jgi:tetratricopeptide (TPR) repeat protein
LLYRLNLIDDLRRLGRTAEARREVEDALELCRKEKVTSLRVADLEGRLGWVLLDEGKVDQARGTFESSLAHYQHLGTAIIEQDTTLYGLGVLALRQRRAAEALPYLEKSLEGRPAGLVPSEAQPRAEAVFDLARALTAVGRTPERACALAREAAGTYRALPARQRDRAAVERWLAEQRCRPGA